MPLTTLSETASTFTSYLAVCGGFMASVNWMAVGAVVLLIARLLVDIPKAYFYWKGINRDQSNREDPR